jgi:hypothetical protein
MMFDLRAVVIAACFILGSIAVAAAAAEGGPEQPARVGSGVSDHAGEARPIRVILPAPWEPARSGAQNVVQK